MDPAVPGAIGRRKATFVCMTLPANNAEYCAPNYCINSNKCNKLDITNANLIGKDSTTHNCLTVASADAMECADG